MLDIVPPYVTAALPREGLVRRNGRVKSRARLARLRAEGEIRRDFSSGETELARLGGTFVG